MARLADVDLRRQDSFSCSALSGARASCEPVSCEDGPGEVTGRRIPAIALAGIGLRIPAGATKILNDFGCGREGVPNNLWLQALLSRALSAADVVIAQLASGVAILTMTRQVDAGEMLLSARDNPALRCRGKCEALHTDMMIRAVTLRTDVIAPYARLSN